MLGMGVRLSGDMQLFNMEKLLDTLPTVAPNAAFAMTCLARFRRSQMNR